MKSKNSRPMLKDLSKIQRMIKDFDKSIVKIDFVKVNMKTSCKMMSYFV